MSVYSARELPFELNLWVEAWLPRRPSRVGALVALVGITEQQDAQSVRTLEYLQTVASKAQLDFIPQERKRPDAMAISCLKLVEQASTIVQVRLERHDAYRHWGLNE